MQNQEADKQAMVKVRVIREQYGKGVKKLIRKRWGGYMRRYRNLGLEPCCEICAFVGEAQWHCHCDDSPKNHINVMPWNLCSEWEPNAGLLMYLVRHEKDE